MINMYTNYATSDLFMREYHAIRADLRLLFFGGYLQQESSYYLTVDYVHPDSKEMCTKRVILMDKQREQQKQVEQLEQELRYGNVKNVKLYVSRSDSHGCVLFWDQLGIITAS